MENISGREFNEKYGNKAYYQKTSSMYIAFELEEKFNIKIPDAALYEAKTVKNIADYISTQKEAK